MITKQNKLHTVSSVNIRRWTYVRYCRSAMTQKLILTGPGTFRRAERKEATDGLDRTQHHSAGFERLLKTFLFSEY